MAKKNNRRSGNRAVVYGRFSSTKQQMQSIEGQFTECDKFANRENYCIIEYFKDEAKTGREMSHRLGLLNMLDYLSVHPEIAYVIVYKMDRLSRNDKDRIEILGRLADMGVTVLKTAEINGTGAAGYLSDGLNSILSVHYSMELAEKTVRGMRQSAKNGSSTGSLPPYGYKWEEKKLVVDETQAPIAKRIFSCYASGQSKKQIADDLNKLGYTNRRGKPWSFKDFENMLKNRKYIGEWYFNGELENEHGNEPIIDVDTFNKVQEMLTINKRQTGGKSRQKREYACSGRIYCKRCGEPMIAMGGAGRGNNKYYYYSCRNARCKVCDKKNERQDKIDNWVVDEIKQTFGLTIDNIDAVAENIANLYEQHQNGDMLSIKKQNLAKANRDQDKLLTIILDQDDNEKSDVLKARFSETNKRIIELKQEIAELEHQKNTLPKVGEIKSWLYDIIIKGTDSMPSVRELINSCIARIYVDNDDNGIIIWQIHNRQIDEDSINAILSENKKSIYTEACIDANELGSPDWT